MGQLELLSTQEAAELTGLSVATINRWTASGKLTPVHKGKGIRGTNVFNKADLIQILKNQKATNK